MIYCIWYPSGGFGHFINSVLTLHGNNFKRPSNKLVFSNTGDSHSLDLLAPKYTADTVDYNHTFDSEYHHSVLIDLGINSASKDFMLQFSNATIIKICYTDISWPIVANAMINKALRSTIELEIPVDPTMWESQEPWAQREKYFLFLRDHHLRNAWKPEPEVDCIFVDSLLEYSTLKSSIESAGIELTDFEDLWKGWAISNSRYLLPVTVAQQIVKQIKNHNNTNLELTNITGIWDQAVIYYFIWLEFNKEVPHNDFKDFFKNVNQITKWLHQ
jgi:hypothetical protein